ncbi:MAG: glycosyltransferase, exosortase A system-associated [Sphingomonadales bacterium]|jgi:PEP-CTERM/exosortase A-associated glycosyltransferase
MRALHIFDHSLPLHSGYSFRSLALLREHRRNGVETYHLTSPKHYINGPNPEKVEGLLFHRSPALPKWVKDKALVDPLMHMHLTAKSALQLAKEIKPDVIHAHSPALTAYAAHRVSNALNIPWIYEIRAFWEDAAASHGGPPEGSLRYRLSQKLENWAISHANAVTAICDGLLDDIRKRDLHQPLLQAIPNAVDVEAFQPPVYDENLAAALGVKGKFVLGFLGSFYAYEGLDILIDALPHMKTLEQVHVLLVGGGPRENELRAQAAHLGLADKISFIGRVPQSEVGRYYGLCDCLVFPRKSIRLTELVTPLKPLEAMAQKKLVLASDIGGHRELIEHGKTGVLFPADDAMALAEAADRWAGSREDWPVIWENGRKFVEEERNWQRSVQGYQRIYSALGLL